MGSTLIEKTTEQRTSLLLLRWSILTTFTVILTLVLLSQVIIQYALFQENIDRQIAALFTRQIVRSQRMQKNSILLLVPGDHSQSDAQLASDVHDMQAEVATFTTQYAGYIPEIMRLKPTASTAYRNVIKAATTLVADERQSYPDYKTRLKVEEPMISLMFYNESDQLGFLQQVQTIIESTTNGYIHAIQLIEATVFLLTILVLCFEYFFVIRSAVQRLAHTEQVLALHEAQKVTPPVAPSVSPAAP